jgi:catalase
MGGPFVDAELIFGDYDSEPRCQAGQLVRQVFDEAERDRLVGNIAGHLLNGVSEPVLQRAFEYWRNVDEDLGQRVEKGVRAGPA